jgi:hypothetical protein
MGRKPRRETAQRCAPRRLPWNKKPLKEHGKPDGEEDHEEECRRLPFTEGGQSAEIDGVLNAVPTVDMTVQNLLNDTI